MNKTHRADNNQAEIVDALRQSGHHVVILSQVGGGCPDLLVSRGGMWWMIEVKTDNSSTTTSGILSGEQCIFINEALGPVLVCRSVSEAIYKSNLVIAGQWNGKKSREQICT